MERLRREERKEVDWGGGESSEMAFRERKGD